MGSILRTAKGNPPDEVSLLVPGEKSDQEKAMTLRSGLWLCLKLELNLGSPRGEDSGFEEAEVHLGIAITRA